MDRLEKYIGTEQEMDAVNRGLRDFAQQQRAGAVGAVHVTCSDESERETAESFQHWFADALLPELKYSIKSPLCAANLGARYEWGSARLAEHHFATPATRDSFKLLVVKINSHVSLVESAGTVVFGQMDRYASPSLFCGAMHVLLDGGSQVPAMDELQELFASEGNDRLAALRDPQQVDPAQRGLLAAVISARLQARRAIVDIQDYQPQTPTVFLVLPCVAIDRKQRNTELLVGAYWSDCRGGTAAARYTGLGDDPARYRVEHRHGMLRIVDDQLHQFREARDHRQEVLSRWQQRRQREAVDSAHLREIAQRVRRNEHHDVRLARETLTTLLWLLADVAPVPAAIMLFAKGAAGIHHLYRAHRLAHGEADHHAAKTIVGQVADRVDKMSAEQARGTIEMLVEQYGL